MTPLAIRSRLLRWSNHLSLGVLEALAWGELGGTRSRSALRHLRACHTCRGRLIWIRRLPAVLERATRIALREDANGVLARRARGERMILPVRRFREAGTDSARAGAPGPGVGPSDDPGRR